MTASDPAVTALRKRSERGETRGPTRVLEGARTRVRREHRRNRGLFLATTVALALVVGGVGLRTRSDESPTTFAEIPPEASMPPMTNPPEVSPTATTFVTSTVPPSRPTLYIQPSGPYSHLQDVTVTGAGFEPGLDITGEIAQCPAGLDTASDEQCGRWNFDKRVIVDPQGTFTLDYRLFDSTPLGVSCETAPGCVLAWVPPHSSMIAVLPIEFA